MCYVLIKLPHTGFQCFPIARYCMYNIGMFTLYFWRSASRCKVSSYLNGGWRARFQSICLIDDVQGFVEFEGCPLDKVAFTCNALWCANFSWIWIFDAVQRFVKFAQCHARFSWSWILEVLQSGAHFGLFCHAWWGARFRWIWTLYTPQVFLPFQCWQGCKVLLKWGCKLRYKVSLLDMKAVWLLNLPAASDSGR